MPAFPILATLLQAAVPPLVPPQPISCTTAEHGQFDFWVGDWEVRPAAPGKGPAGRSRIERVLNGCAIHERFTAEPREGKSPYQGSSYSSWDPRERRWRQAYVDTNGRATAFLGGSNGVGMILWAWEQAPAGPYMRRMEVVPQPDGTVRQTGFVSIDNGGSWRMVYDLIYRRAAPAARPDRGCR
jgi:hypothetical protein